MFKGMLFGDDAHILLKVTLADHRTAVKSALKFGEALRTPLQKGHSAAEAAE